MNKVTLIGRLTKDPELKYTPGNGVAVCSFNLAVENYNSKTQQKGADFIPVVVWNKAAENVAQYCIKGSQIAVSGRISVRTYDAQDGTKRYVTEVVADAFNGIMFLGSKNNSEQTQPQEQRNTTEYTGEDIGMPVDDGDMPF